MLPCLAASGFSWQRIVAFVLATELVCVAAPAAAQKPTTDRQAPARGVRITGVVRDSSGTPVENATVLWITGHSETRTVAATDGAGRFRFEVPHDTLEHEILVRRIGFRPGHAFLRLRDTVTKTVEVQLRRLVQTLAPVVVEERQSWRERTYFVDSESVLADGRPMYDAFDIARKLRPAMLGDRARNCRGVKHLFVNGRRQSLGMIALAMLRDIDAQHVLEMRYVNCWDKSMPGVAGQDAIHVILKPGVSYSAFRGSYVDPGR
jgi:hypothetical protein